MDWNNILPTRVTLLNRIRRWDDQESWKEFYDLYKPLIRATALRRGLNELEADEVVQDTMCALTSSLPGFRYDPERCAFKTWLHVITKRQVARKFQSRIRNSRMASIESLDESWADTASAEADTRSDAWDEEWERGLLHTAMERVRQAASPAQFQLYDYHVLQSHSASETATAFAVSVAKVYLVKHRVLRQLRREVSKLRKKLE